MNIKPVFSLLVSGVLFTSFAMAQDTTGLAIPQQKFQKLMKKKNTVVVDVRTPEEYKTGFISKAINYNVADSLVFVNSLSTLDKNKKYLLYCKSGRRSGKALVLMKNIGFSHVRHLKGGVTEWKGELKRPL